MQPNGPQNYWQPQNDQSGTPPSAPSQPGQQPTSQGSQPAQQPSAATVNVTPHSEAFAAPRNDKIEPVDHEPEASDEPVLSWEASEYINHEKDILWYLGFVIAVLVFLVAAIWVQAWTFVVLIVIMAAATIVYINRPPRTMRYSLSSRGLHIGAQFHPYSEYRAFGVVDDGPFMAIMLVSTKRFMPATLIYFAEQDGDKIVQLFSQHLPMEELDLDIADIIIRKLRL